MVRGELLPELVTGVGQPEMKVVVGGQRVEQLDVGYRKPRVSEEREPLWQVGRRLMKPHNGFGVPDVRWVDVDAVDEHPPQFRLPLQVLVEAVGHAVEPVDEQLRPLFGVRRKQAGEATRDGVAPALAQFLLLGLLEVAEMCCKRLAPRFSEAIVDHLEQRPDERVGRPRIVVDGPGDLGDERVRVAERDAGTDAVGTGAAAEDVRQPLAEPSLDAFGRHDDQLLGERIVERIGQQRAEPVGKQVGSLGTVKMKCHRLPR